MDQNVIGKGSKLSSFPVNEIWFAFSVSWIRQFLHTISISIVISVSAAPPSGWDMFEGYTDTLTKYKIIFGKYEIHIKCYNATFSIQKLLIFISTLFLFPSCVSLSRKTVISNLKIHGLWIAGFQNRLMWFFQFSEKKKTFIYSTRTSHTELFFDVSKVWQRKIQFHPSLFF